MNRRLFSQLLASAAVAPTAVRLGAQATSVPPAVHGRFSVMLWALGHNVSLESLLDIASGAGYQGVELTTELTRWTPKDAAAARKQIASRDLVVDAIDGGRYTLADPATATTILQPLGQRIALAKELGCAQLILTPGRSLDGVDKNRMHATIADTLQRAGDLAAKDGLEVLLEPIDLIESRGTASVYSVADAFDIVRSIAHPSVKVLYDFYHEQRGCGNLLEKLDHNVDLIGLVHIADVPGRHHPGSGEINYSRIYQRLSELKYDRMIAMEFYPLGDSTDDLKSARLSAIQALSAKSA